MWLYDINKWFENYDKWVHQAERAERLGIAWEQKDKMLGITYHSLDDLDVCAEEMRKQYIELKNNFLKKLQNKSKNT